MNQPLFELFFANVASIIRSDPDYPTRDACTDTRIQANVGDDHRDNR